MASVEAYTALKDTIETELSPVQVIDFDSIETAVQQAETAFIALEEVTEDDDLIGFGGNFCNRETSIIATHHFTPAPESSAAARQFAQNTQDLLRNQLLLASGVRVIAADPPSPTASNSGLWTIYTVPITIELDTTRPRPTPLP